MRRFILALDQGTTSSRAIVFDRRGRAVATAQQEFAQHYPRPGWVEHDPRDLWASTRRTALGAVAEANLTGRAIAALGLTNQRETTLLWDRRTGRPLHRAIVWQDRRTAAACAALKRRGLESLFRQRTGLLLDPYFSGTKLAWLLDHVPVPAGAPKEAISPSAPWTPGCSGSSPAVASMPPTPPTPRAPSCSTCAPPAGTTSS